jgi:hypothetical protein
MAAMLNKALPSHPTEGSGSGGHIHRSVSESVAYPTAVSPPTLTKTGGFSHFLRKRKQNSVDDTPPPPTPPKDSQVYPSGGISGENPLSRHSPQSSYDYSHNYEPFGRQRGNSTSAVIHITRDELDMVVIEPQRPPTALEAKWASEPAVITDPTERARLRNEAKRQKEEEERRAMEEEAERQRVIKLNKQIIMEQEVEEQRLRKAMLEQELRRANTERMKREQELKEEDELRQWESAERRRLERERRGEEARRLEELRIGEQRKSEELVRRQEEDRERRERERKARIKVIEAKIRKEKTAETMTGWLTVQNSDSLTLMWRRRFFQFVGSKICLYRSPKVRFSLKLLSHVTYFWT